MLSNGKKHEIQMVPVLLEHTPSDGETYKQKKITNQQD